MPPSFVLAIVCAVLALLFVIVALVKRKDVERRNAGLGFAGVLTVLCGLLLINASANIVPTKNVGIVTEFKKDTGATTGAGWAWVKPWQKIDSWEASRQTYDHLDEKRCVQVRIVGLQTACVEIKIEYSTKADQAPEQWASYKEHDFNLFIGRRIDPNLTNAVNVAYETHNPLSNVDVKTGVVNPPPKAPFVEGIRAEVEKTIGADVTVHSVVIGFVHYNEDTQKSIEAYQQKVLEARNLAVDLQNAETRRQITAKNSQRDLRAWCLEIAEKQGKEPGFCFGGGTPVQVTNK